MLGYVKSLTLIVLSAVTFHDELSPLNVAGVVLTFSSTCLYSWLKRGQASKSKPSQQQVAYEILSVLELANNWSDDEDEARSRSPADDDPCSVVGEQYDVDPADMNAAVGDGVQKEIQRRSRSVAL